MNNLEKNLYLKHDLRFNKNGILKILMLSDIQETLRYDRRTLESMEKLLKKEKPDLVILGGDICDGTVLKTEEELREYLNIFTSPMEQNMIPWCHVFGNHDHDIELDDIKKAKIYEEYSYCISKHTEDIYGTTNFVLPVRSCKTDEIKFNIWGLDSNNKIWDSNIDIKYDVREYKGPANTGEWDIVHFDQLMWYWNSSVELEKYCGKKVSGMMVIHIPPHEFQFIVDNPEMTGAEGSAKEIMNIGMFNSGLFAALLQRNDIKCIAGGHSHNDCFSGDFCGIKMCLDACAGYSAYGSDELRGGRVFILKEDDTDNIETYMSFYKDL